MLVGLGRSPVSVLSQRSVYEISRLAQDQICVRRPHERFRISIPLVQIVKHGLLQRSNRRMASTPDASFRHFYEQSFHQVQPTTTRRGEVDVITRVARHHTFVPC